MNIDSKKSADLRVKEWGTPTFKNVFDHFSKLSALNNDTEQTPSDSPLVALLTLL